MKTHTLTVGLLASLAFAHPALAFDEERGIIAEDAAPRGGVRSGLCTLEVQPTSLRNGEEFAAIVRYFPSAPGGKRVERYQFTWPSRCPGYEEATTMRKQLDTATSASVAFGLVPAATCIEGTFTATVIVVGAYTCTARSEPLTITNP